MPYVCVFELEDNIGDKLQRVSAALESSIHRQRLVALYDLRTEPQRMAHRH